MAVTVQDALNLSAYQECQLRAGRGGLNHIILYTDSMEVPDIQPWLRPNLLMITTGYSLCTSQNPAALKQLLIDLHHTGSAGIAIKTRFIGTLSQDIIDTANQLNIPLILVPDDMPASSLVVPLMQMIYNDQTLQLQSNYFYIDLISGSIQSEQEARMRAEAMQWPKLPLCLVLFNSKEFSRQEEIMKTLESIVDSMVPSHILLSNNDHFIFLLPDALPKPLLENLCQTACRSISQHYNILARAGISKKITEYTSLHQAFQDALDALKIGAIENPDKIPFFISEFTLEQALLDFKGNEKLRSCLHETFTQLEDYDRHHNSNLLETLSVLTASLGSKAEAAKRLFLHRNTLLYRIKKIEELTGFDLSDSRTIADLSFFFKIRPYI